MVINSYSISDYYRLNYHRLLIIIGGYYKLNYHKLLMTTGDYYINGYYWLFYYGYFLLLY
jgi:hypothetical protein